jgi:hypothetical protein
MSGGIGMVKNMRAPGRLGPLVALPAIWMLLACAPAGSLAAGGCPNEATRAELGSERLPDCRSYELVTPSEKYGWYVSEIESAVSGERLVMKSLGAFSGAKQLALKYVYETERTPGGWVTTPVAGPPSGFVNVASETILAETNDLGVGLFEYASPSAAERTELNFYARRLPADAVEEIGPVFSPAALASNPDGAIESPVWMSSRGGVLLYSLAGPSPINGGVNYLWPGDATVEDTGGSLGGLFSLYEYAGIGNTSPTLIGVDNAGRQISQCGTVLGYPRKGSFASSDTDDGYNAVSPDGSHVFFTAAAAASGPSLHACTESGAGTGPPVNELVARISHAATGTYSSVPISQPTFPLAQGAGNALDECNASCETAAPQEGIFQGASEDGSKVFFLTKQPLLNGDHDSGMDLYEAELQGEGNLTTLGRLVEVSRDPNPAEPAEVQGVVRVAADGSHVYFVAKGVLTSMPGPTAAVAQAGADNFYTYETGTHHVAFIADLCSGPATSGTVTDMQCPATLNSLPPTESGDNDLRDWQIEDSRPVDITPDGRSLVFTSRGDLTPGDTSAAPQVFEYDAQADTLTRVSIGQAGYNNNGNTSNPQLGASIVFPRYDNHGNPGVQLSSVSANGDYVVFESSNALTPQALTNYPNVYEYHLGQLALISDGQDRTQQPEGIPSTGLLGIDSSGADIFFATGDELVPQDGDTQADVYDARVDGGFSPQPPPQSCSGEECQGQLTGPPTFSSALSATQPAEQPTTLPVSRPKPTTAPKPTSRRCKRGFMRRKAKCVKRKATRARKRRGTA